MSTTVRGQPSGRAGRVWLDRRRGVADRGAGLLETKLRILAAEEQRFDLLVERTEQEWESAVAEADRWLSRARLLSGRRGLRLARAPEPAQVGVAWEATMGVHYPASTTVHVPEGSPEDPTPNCSALALAARAYRQALAAGCEYAAATAARDAIRAETSATRRRLRALEKRWLPGLDAAAQALAESLEEDEREDGVRMRWSAARLGSGTEEP
jgi:V/A-type H+-transporting ATPase subunit D